MIDFNKLGALAAQTEDMSIGKDTSKGVREVPAAGKVMLRLRDYIELGEFNKSAPYTGVKIESMFTFEILSKNYYRDYGRGLEPQIISATVNKSDNLKGDYMPLFNALNYDNSCKHILQMVGRPCIGTIIHRKSDNGNVYANLRDESRRWHILPPFVEDLDTGEVKQYNVPPLHGKPCFFLWEPSSALIDDSTYLAMWESIYREGNNWMQEKVMTNNKFNGSRLQGLLNGSHKTFNQFVQQVQQVPQQSTVINQERAQQVQVTGTVNTVLGQFAPNKQFNDDYPF